MDVTYDKYTGIVVTDGSSTTFVSKGTDPNKLETDFIMSRDLWSDVSLTGGRVPVKFL
ncbi:hypothetical protein [Francisella tularensis]|uniref:hypothetical protein n=1 Tax=Francisella tularensis TaxID=263 RepID=UPI001319CF6F|nr:hypothetical protein [Francisella tularensis]